MRYITRDKQPTHKIITYDFHYKSVVNMIQYYKKKKILK